MIKDQRKGDEMWTKKVVIALVMMKMVFSGSAAIAGDIEAGTFSVRASSNAAFNVRDYENGHSNQLCLSTGLGYFFFENWEIGAELTVSFGETSNSSYRSYYLSPYIGYHWSLGDKSSLYGLIGGGYGIRYDDYDFVGDNQSEVVSVFAELGYEYFLTRNVSLGLGVRGEQSEYELEYDSSYGDLEEDDTLKELSTRLSFKLYF